MPDVATSKAVLRKRVRRLLRLDRGKEDQSELRTKILPFLQSLGEVALIGGAIRDLARCGRAGFASDLDFVIYDAPCDEVRNALIGVGGKSNRFGGFALRFHQWKVDVWHLEDTWARTVGARRVESISDLLSCTFFDWDAVIFDLKSGQLIYEEAYLSWLKNRVMELRLEENPNPAGSLVRALRRAALWQIRFGPELSRFSSHYIRTFRWDDLVERDRRAFGSSVLAYLNPDTLIQRLESVKIIEGRPLSFPVPDWEWQPKLSLLNEVRSDLSPGQLSL
jgi:hypothetical protein